MGRKTKIPAEDPTVVRQRQQSILDQADLNDETNRRIKQLRSAGRGVRAFRAMNSGSGASAGAVGSTAAGGTSLVGGSSGGTPGGYGNLSWGINGAGG